MTARGGRLWGVLVLAGLCIAPVWTQESAGRAPAADLSVPADLKPLLAAPQSEMRLVTLLYNTDRTTLNGDFDTGRSGWTRWARRTRGGSGERRGCCGAASAGALGEARRALETVRHGLAGGPRDARRVEAVGGGARGPRKPQDCRRGGLDAARFRCRGDRRARAADAVCDYPHRSVGGADSSRRRGLSKGSRSADGCHATDRRDARAPRERPGRGVRPDEGDRNKGSRCGGRPSQQHDHLVQLLEQLRPCVHVVDGHAVPAVGCGTAGVRGIPPATVSAGRRLDCTGDDSTDCRRAGARDRRGPGSRNADAASAGRNDADRRAVRLRRRRRARRCRAWSRPGKCRRRPCRDQQPWVWPSEAVPTSTGSPR